MKGYISRNRNSRNVVVTGFTIIKDSAKGHVCLQADGTGKWVPFPEAKQFASYEEANAAFIKMSSQAGVQQPCEVRICVRDQRSGERFYLSTKGAKLIAA